VDLYIFIHVVQTSRFATGSGTYDPSTGSVALFYSGSNNTDFWNNFSSSVNQNNAAGYTATYDVLGGNAGNGLHFVNLGASEGVLVSGSTAGSLLASGSFSYSMWFYQTSSFFLAPQGHFFQIKDDDFIGTSAGNNIAFKMTTAAFQFERKTTTATRTWGATHGIKSGLEDQWNNVVLTYRNDTTASAGMVSIYINGESKTVTLSAGAGETISGSGDTNSAVAWMNDETGSTAGAYNENLKRITVKEFSWWNKELSSDDITAIYNNGAPVDYSTGSWNELAHYWPFSGSSDNFDPGTAPSYNGSLFLEDLVGSDDITGSVKQTAGTEISWYNVPLSQSQVALFQITASAAGANYNDFTFTTSSTQWNPFVQVNPLEGGSVLGEGTPEVFVYGTRNKFDNFNVSRTIPSQDYNYSWVTSSLGEELSVRSGNQLSFGYWPKDGILSASANLSWRRNGFDSAVNFPTGSEILGS
jgi:hypothetical protein